MSCIIITDCNITEDSPGVLCPSRPYRDFIEFSLSIAEQRAVGFILALSLAILYQDHKHRKSTTGYFTMLAQGITS